MRARKPKLTISEKDQKQLETIARSRMEPAGKIQRAKIQVCLWDILSYPCQVKIFLF